MALSANRVAMVRTFQNTRYFQVSRASQTCTIGVQVKLTALASTGYAMAEEPDPIAIRLVALDGHKMPLTKEDRIEAIKLMASNNVNRVDIAWRLCINLDALERFARSHQIKLPPRKPPAHWTSGYIDTRNPKARERNAERKRQLRRTAKDA